MFRLLFKDKETGKIFPLWERYDRKVKDYKFYRDLFGKEEVDASKYEEIDLEGENSPKLPFTLFGIECGYGWLKLIEPVVEYIDNYNRNKENLEEMIHIHQIKEKYGTLRIYTNFGTKDLFDLIDEAERKSEFTCETCGKEADLSKNGVEIGVGQTCGWIETICMDCLKKRTENESRAYFWEPCDSKDLYFVCDGKSKIVPEEEKKKIKAI